jgi:iron transport multicopper oxidase
MRALPNAGTLNYTDGVNSAILRYDGASLVEPTTQNQTSSDPLVETNLHPLDSLAAPGTPEPGAADVNLELVIEQVTTPAGPEFLVNNATFSPPTVPVLLQIISGASTPQDILPSGSVYVLPHGKVIEISMPGGSGGSPVSASIFIH